MFDHRLSDGTLHLIEHAIREGGRLSIYGTHNWAVECVHSMNRLAFDPFEDNQALHDVLSRMIAGGLFRAPE